MKRIKTLSWRVLIFITAPLWIIALFIFVCLTAYAFKDVDWDEYEGDADHYYL